MAGITRRHALQLGFGTAVMGATGCLAPTFDPPKLSITALNFDDEYHRLSVELWRADRNEATDAFVFSEEYELPASGADVVDARDDDVVRSRRYLVRAEIDGQVDAHYHFFPDCGGGDGPDERLYVEIHSGTGPDSSGPELDFQQNRCGGDGFR